MQQRWQRFAIRLLVWFVAEIVFNLFGLDDLADASEFVFRHYEALDDNQLAYVRVFTVGQVESSLHLRAYRFPA